MGVCNGLCFKLLFGHTFKKDFLWQNVSWPNQSFKTMIPVLELACYKPRELWVFMRSPGWACSKTSCQGYCHLCHPWWAQGRRGDRVSLGAEGEGELHSGLSRPHDDRGRSARRLHRRTLRWGLREQLPPPIHQGEWLHGLPRGPAHGVPPTGSFRACSKWKRANQASACSFKCMPGASSKDTAWIQMRGPCVSNFQAARFHMPKPCLLEGPPSLRSLPAGLDGVMCRGDTLTHTVLTGRWQLVSQRTVTLKAALSVHTGTTPTKERVTFTFVNVWKVKTWDPLKNSEEKILTHTAWEKDLSPEVSVTLTWESGSAGDRTVFSSPLLPPGGKWEKLSKIWAIKESTCMKLAGSQKAKVNSICFRHPKLQKPYIAVCISNHRERNLILITFYAPWDESCKSLKMKKWAERWLVPRVYNNPPVRKQTWALHDWI